MSMRLNAPPGQKVRFTNTGGHDAQRMRAGRSLSTQRHYEVERVDVGRTYSYVYLKGVQENENGFNTVMFEEVGDLLEPVMTVRELYEGEYPS